MANSLHIGAEFDSYDDFKQAFKRYCQTTKVNGEPVKFVHFRAKYIKNYSVPSGVQQRLQYIMKRERCEFAGKTSCRAAYELVLHTKPNGDRILRLKKFHGEHNSHLVLVQSNPESTPKAMDQSDSSSQEKLKKVVKKIQDSVKNWPDSKYDPIAEILENMWDRTMKNITFKVDFTDYPPENGKFL